MAVIRVLTSVIASVALLTAGTATAQITGDFNLDGVLDAADLNLQAIQIVNGPFDPPHDLNNDGVLDFDDREVWVHELKNLYFGDANMDGEFISGDLVQVFVAGKYETGEDAGWEEGDWNADMRFNSSDLVTTFSYCGYDSCPYENRGRRRPAREPVPEPSDCLLLLMAAGVLLAKGGRQMALKRTSTGLVVIVMCLTTSAVTAQIVGDHNWNGVLDAADLNLQAIEMHITPDLAEFDLNGDDIVDYDDRRVWVEDLKKTWFGDANLDLEFNSSDMTQVFQRGRYEKDQDAWWDEGDWDGSQRFDSSDMVWAFVDGGYEKGLRPDAVPVPEPSAWLLLVLAATALLASRGMQMAFKRTSTGLVVVVVCLSTTVTTAQILGDHNRNGVLDAADLNLQAIEMNKVDPDLSEYDLNGDGFVNYDDRKLWVEGEGFKNSWMGDANLDLEFNSSDMVQVFVAGKYETGQTAGWEEGDQNGDMRFSSSDLVWSGPGGYEVGLRPDDAAVPEPGGWLLLAIAVGALLTVRHRRQL